MARGTGHTSPDDTVPVVTAQRRLHARHTLVRHSLQKTDVETELIPLDRRSFDAHEGQRNRRVPLLRRLHDQVVERFADLVILTVVCVCRGEQNKRVSRQQAVGSRSGRSLFKSVPGKW